MNKIPNSLDSVTMTAINTVIACEGANEAYAKYQKLHSQDPELIPAWVVSYCREYAKRHRKSFGSYIDVSCATHILEQLRGEAEV